MDDREYTQLMRSVHAVWPSWKLTADAMEYGECLLMGESLSACQEVLRRLACEYVDFPPASLGVIKKKLDELSGRGNTTDHLYLQVIEWLKVDERHRIYDEELESSYGLDRWVDPGRPPKHPELPKDALAIIDQSGGPQALYEAIVLQQNTTVVAQFKKSLQTVRPEREMQALTENLRHELESPQGNVQ